MEGYVLGSGARTPNMWVITLFCNISRAFQEMVFVLQDYCLISRRPKGARALLPASFICAETEAWGETNRWARFRYR